MLRTVIITIAYGERLELDMCKQRFKKQNAFAILVRKFRDIGLNKDDYEWIGSEIDSEENRVQTYKQKKVA